MSLLLYAFSLYSEGKNENGSWGFLGLFIGEFSFRKEERK
jgi:hypothetical protein